MKINWKEETKENIIAYSISGIIVVAVWFMFSSWESVSRFFSGIFGSLKPFLLGFCLCFILVPMRRIVEEKWLAKTKMTQRGKRKWAVTISIILFILILVMFFMILTPQITVSMRHLAANLDRYMDDFNKFVGGLGTDYGKYSSVVTKMFDEVEKFLQKWISGADGIVDTIVSYSLTFVKGIFDFFVGIIIAVYLLLDQEKFKAQVRKFNYGVFSKEYAEHLTEVASLSAEMFNNFIFGKALDSLVVGIICYISCVCLRMPYAPLIGFTIGITNMIPVFGPFLGAIPCIFILLIVNPFKALEFSIFILILQQIDGNILGPYILGDSMGLPALWVMFAIISGGAIFGVLGMFLGVPLFSVIYVLLKRRINARLAKNQIEIPKV